MYVLQNYTKTDKRTQTNYSLHEVMNLTAGPFRSPRLNAGSGAYDQLPTLFLKIAEFRFRVLHALQELDEGLASGRQLALQAAGQPTKGGQSTLAFAQLLLAAAVGNAAVGQRATFLRQTDRWRVAEFRRHPASSAHFLRRRVFQHRPAVLQQQPFEPFSFSFQSRPKLAFVCS